MSESDARRSGGRTAVVWFRRDLRVHDHPALARAASAFDRVAPVFVLDERLIGPAAGVSGGAGAADGAAVVSAAGAEWPAVRSPNRVWFMLRCVAELAESLAKLGAPLTILRGDAAGEVARFARDVEADAVLISRDYAPYGRRRDSRASAALRGSGVRLEEAPGILVHEPEEVLRSDGGHYTVFSPFLRSWQRVPMRESRPAPERLEGSEHAGRGRDLLADLLATVRPTADPTFMPVPGEAAARDRLARWASSPALPRYDEGRDRLDLDGTSRLSQDLRWGTLSPVDVLTACHSDAPGPRRFEAELAWRDFYAHLLWHRPELVRHALRPELEDVARFRGGPLADAWRSGRTGYPVLDAAMRQLLATGWMHNRARMIAASFLTKQLGVDWRVGAAHFMEHLVDGDVASNTGGWQWAASTGADPQPWFRLFNPLLQARRHDPTGDYVRRWVPELAEPRADYPPPIVDATLARAAALAAYRERARRSS